MVIQTNVAALMSYRESAKTNRAMKKTLEKLSSGYRINRSADDASGLAVSERMRIYCTEYGRCHTNAKEGLNLAKTADGALAEVNDMLRRARELCIQAENGTYSEQELASISDEMNELFGEIDRITEGSFFNEIQLFRGEQGVDFHYEYDETYAALPESELAEWGEMDFVDTTEFDAPPPAKRATATFKLDDGVDFGNINSLNGRAIKVGGYTYYFTDGTVPEPSTTYPDSPTPLYLSNYSSTLQALGALGQAADGSTTNKPFVMTVDQDTRTMTLLSQLNTKDDGSFDAIVEGKLTTISNYDGNGNGSWANGKVAAQNVSGTSSLKEVDGQGIRNNTAFYSDTATCAINLSYLSDNLTADNVKNLNGNKLSLPGGHDIQLSSLGPSVNMSREDFANKLVTRIKTFDGYDASYDSGTRQITVTRTGLPTNSASAGYISEGITQAKTHLEETTMFTSSALNCTFAVPTPASGERIEVSTVTIPSTSNAPFSITINNTKYLYYDPSKNPLLKSGDDYTTYNGNAYPRPSLINISNMDRTAIIRDIASKIRGIGGVGDVKINGDTITVTANALYTSVNLSSYIKGTAIEVKSLKTVTDTPGTNHVFGSGSSKFQKKVTVPFSLGKDLDVDKLAGSGFGIRYGYYNTEAKFEFTKGTSLHADYTDIDISGCTSFEDLRDKVRQVLGRTYEVELDTTDADNTKLLISRTGDDTAYVSDGATGIQNLISGDEPVKYDGGSDIGYSEVQIDFSSINSSNLDELLGKGFRINCATCTGEYINIFFCWENNGQVPESFKVDADTGERLPDDADIMKENVRVINNFSVELSKVTSGDQIVQSIVDQVKSSLKHFTDVDVGSPPTTLIARDKRLGGAKVNSAFKPAEVVTGLNTNFTYSVNIRKVEEYPEDGSVVAKENIVDIYVGSEPNPQIIPIHLPYIDLKTLRLRPPETVDLNDAEQDASDWLNRVDQANLFISKSRGVIGADHNRLESAVQALSHAKENITDAESRIRDTDMAEEMMEHIKLQILTQSQQSMLSQAMARPQQVLQLIS